MAKASQWAKAGLVFMQHQDIDIVSAANNVASGLETMDHVIEGVHILSDLSAQVSTNSHDMTIDLKDDVASPSGEIEAPQLCLVVKLSSRHNTRSARFARDAILARSIQTLNTELSPDFIQWQNAAFLLPSESFAAATGVEDNCDPQTRRDASSKTSAQIDLPDVEQTNAVLQNRLTSHDPEIFENQASPDRLREIFSDGWVDPALIAQEEAARAYAREMEDIEVTAPLRLSAWLMSFSVALYALPVGVALLIVNLAKGENLRLSSQTAALTGTFVAFQAMGTTADAMAALQQIVQ